MAKTPREQLTETVEYATRTRSKELAESALRRLAQLDTKDADNKR